MENKFLTDLGITEDVAAKIISQAEAEAKTAGEASAAVQAQLDVANKQLADANKQIEDFKGMDVDKIKAAADDYKAKFEASEADKAALQHQYKLDGYVKGLGLRDDVYEAHIAKQLTDAGLKFGDDGKLVGGDDIVGKFRETHPDAFGAKPGDGPRFAGVPGTGSQSVDGVEAAFYAKNPELKK